MAALSLPTTSTQRGSLLKVLVWVSVRQIKQVWFLKSIPEESFTFSIAGPTTLGYMKDRIIPPRAITPPSGGFTPVTSHKIALAWSDVHLTENDNGSESSSHTSRPTSVVTLNTVWKNNTIKFVTWNHSMPKWNITRCKELQCSCEAGNDVYRRSWRAQTQWKL